MEVMLRTGTDRFPLATEFHSSCVNVGPPQNVRKLILSRQHQCAEWLNEGIISKSLSNRTHIGVRTPNTNLYLSYPSLYSSS